MKFKEELEDDTLHSSPTEPAQQEFDQTDKLHGEQITNCTQDKKSNPTEKK